MTKFDITVIGTSWGGLQAMETILGSLPKNLAIAIAVAQHRHKDSEGELVACLQRCSLLPVVEAVDKQPIAPGQNLPGSRRLSFISRTRSLCSFN
jgi:two-component system, chemotaxis family, protein-glutamate methylesterase/glutaminase